MEISKNNQHTRDEPVRLLWTGGWDSTFRLLQLLLSEKKMVQPHYVIIPQECAGTEIDTIHNIRRQLSRQYPETRDLLLPIEFIDSGKIKPNEKITAAYDAIKEKMYIAVQYEVIARYCEQNGYERMEIGIEKNSHSHRVINDYLTDDEVSVFKIDKEKSPESFYDLFRQIRFPLLEYDKIDMENVARERNWIDVMNMAWFCRRPSKGRPCGFCGPCTDVLIDGMGWRLPLRARLFAYIQLPFRKWWRRNYDKRSTKMYQQVKTLLKNKV